MQICAFYYNPTVNTIRDTYNNNKLARILIKTSITLTTIAIVNGAFPSIAYAAGTGKAVARAKTMGEEIWKVVLMIARFAFLGYGGKDIIKEVLAGDSKDVIKAVAKYGLGYALLRFFPDILDWIESF